jgi:hypothetical protein
MKKKHVKTYLKGYHEHSSLKKQIIFINTSVLKLVTFTKIASCPAINKMDDFSQINIKSYCSCGEVRFIGA